jgi:hypothetical protein
MFLVLSLLALYFINIRFIPKDIEIEQWRTIITIMNFAFCGLILATLAVRFIYPLYSLEGDAVWVLGSAPISTVTLFREKFWLSFIMFLIITEAIAYISGAILNLEGLYQIMTVTGIFMMSVSLSCLAVGLGVAYPDFSERNPSRIASSPGGILTVVCAIFYIAAMLVLIAIPGYQYTRYLVTGGDFPVTAVALSAAAATVVNAVTIIIPLRVGARSLKMREF